MTNEEFSNGFDTLVNSYRRFKDFDKKEELDSIEFDEYEKSLFLTKAQNQIVVELYSGRNGAGLSFEATEEVRRYLDTLVISEILNASDPADEGLISIPLSSKYKSYVFGLPSTLAFILYESVKFEDSSLGCLSDSIAKEVVPVTHDELATILQNPFRGPNKRRVLRLDRYDTSCIERSVELISRYTLDDESYFVRYLSYPKPIILEDLDSPISISGEQTESTCQLPELIHDTILDRAVRLALQSKGLNIQ